MNFYQGILAVWDIASTLTKTGDRRIGSRGPATQELTSRMLKKTASGVLASRRGSMYRRVCLASSLTAALLNGLFEHPVVIQIATPFGVFQPCFSDKPSFSAAC